MDEVTVVKREIQAVEWAERIRECNVSGLSIAKWCKLNNVNVRAYYYQLRKIREKAIKQIPVPISTVTQALTSQSSDNLEIKVHIGNAIVQIPNGMPEQTITAVLGALKQ